MNNDVVGVGQSEVNSELIIYWDLFFKHTTQSPSKYQASWELGVKGQNRQSGWRPRKGNSYVRYQGWANEVGGECLSREASGPRQEPQQHFENHRPDGCISFA